jgi:ribosomal protein S14
MKCDQQCPGDYHSESLGTTYAQAYADDIVLVDETPEGQQRQINACEHFLTFAGISLNPDKSEVFKVESKKGGDAEKIVIAGMTKEYIPEADYIKYLGAPLGSKRRGAFKYGSKVVNSMLDCLEKIEHSWLAPNQIIHAIKTFIIPKLHYASANNAISIDDLKHIDGEIRRVINQLVTGQKLPLDFIYLSYKDGGLGIPRCEDEYYTYKIYHAAHLMKTEHGRRILKGYGKLNLNQRLPAFQMLFPAIEKALEKLNLKWDDFKMMKRKTENDFGEILKRNNKCKLECPFGDKQTGVQYKANLKRVNATCNKKKQRNYRTKLYSKTGRKDLVLTEGNGNISNYYFNNNKNFMNEGLFRFLVKTRSGTMWTPERKHRILHDESDACPRCGKTGRLSHMLNSCPNCFREMTERHDDICQIIAQQLKHEKKRLIPLEGNKKKKFKAKIGWNSQIRPPFVQTKNETIEMKEEENSIHRRPDLWFYKVDIIINKENSERALTLNLVEVTVPIGYSTGDFPRTLNGVINEAETLSTSYCSLKKAPERKTEKIVN